jgi:hypothetical protein
MMRLCENVIAMIAWHLRDGDKLLLSCASKALRAMAKRSTRIAMRASDAEACLAAFPATIKLASFGFIGNFDRLASLVSLTLERTCVEPTAMRAMRALRNLVLVRCACASLDASGLSLVSLSIVAPAGCAPTFGALTTLETVALEDVSYCTLASLTDLARMTSLSITAPYPCASRPRPLASIAALTTLRTLRLRAVDAIGLHLGDLRGLRLSTLCIEMCILCCDDPFLLMPSVARVGGHDCCAYARRIDLTRADVERVAVEDVVDALAAAADPSEYELYLQRRLACPLLANHQGLRLLFRASLSQFDDTYRDALALAVLLVRA